MVIFFDIDGTIVDDATQIIPDSAVGAVAALGRNGHLAVVNTGRPFGHIDPRVRRMAFGGWICGCGMEIRLGDCWLIRRAPTEEVCRYTVESVRACGMQVLYEGTDGLYRDGCHSDDPVPALEEQRLRKKGLPVAEISTLPVPKFMKFVTYDTAGCNHEEFIRRMEPHFTCIDRSHGMMEYVLKGCSKAGGMEMLLNHLDIGQTDTLAIGDSTNDLPMFAAASHNVCMGSGMDALKAQAEFITASVLDDGIEKALKHFGLI